MTIQAMLKAGGIVLFLGLLSPSAAAQEIAVIDDAGRTVVLDQPATRVVATSPANTQLLLSLGIKERVVGVTSLTGYLSYAPELQRIAEEKRKVGDAAGLNIEQIVGVAPDLVVLDGDQQQMLSRLRELAGPGNFAIYVNSPESVDGIIENLRELGRLTEAEDTAERVAGEMRRELGELERLVSGLDERLSLLYVIYGPDPLWTAGGETFLGKSFELAGLRNVFSDIQGYTQVSREQVIDRNPDVILLSPDVPIEINRVASFFGSSLNAVEADRVIRVGEGLGSMLEQRQTEVTRGMLELHRLVYGRLSQATPSPSPSSR